MFGKRGNKLAGTVGGCLKPKQEKKKKTKVGKKCRTCVESDYKTMEIKLQYLINQLINFTSIWSTYFRRHIAMYR